MRAGTAALLVVVGLVVCAATAAIALGPRGEPETRTSTGSAPAPPGYPPPSEVPTISDAPAAETPPADDPADTGGEDRPRVAEGAECSVPGGPVHVLVRVLEVGDRGAEGWAQLLLSEVAREANKDEQSEHVHGRVEPDGATVRVWLHRMPTERATATWDALLARMRRLDPRRHQLERRRISIEEQITLASANLRIREVDRRATLAGADAEPETLDVSIRTVEAEIDAWTTERARARARRGLPELSDEERAEYDAYLEQADAEIERLTKRLLTLRVLAQQIAELDAELDTLRESKRRLMTEKNALGSELIERSPFLRVTDLRSDR